MAENTIIVTRSMAQAEIDRRADNRERKLAARKSGQKYTPRPAADEVVMHLSGAALSELVGDTPAPAPKPAPAKVKTTPAWNEPGVRGGDPLKRNRGLLADASGADKGTPEWWAAYRATKGFTLEECGVWLGFIVPA